MNATLIGRLFWKEYRTQRGLWLAIVAIFVTTAVASVVFLPVQQRPGFEGLLASGYITILFYLLASVAVLYASEKEQQTDILLRTLPLNKWLLLGVKLSWVIVTSLVALGVFALFAWLMSEPERVSQNMFPDSQVWIGLAYLVTCALVASLLCRNVLTAIGLAVGLMAVGPLTFELIDRVFVDLDSIDSTTAFGSLSLIMSVIALELNRRWFLERDRQWRGVSFGRAVTLEQALALPVEANATARFWRRLLWKEWLSARLWLVAIPILFVGLFSLIQLDVQSETIGWRFSILFVLVPLLFGIGSCRSDQHRDHYLFAGNRGIAAFPALVAKHFIWIGACVAIVLGLSFLLAIVSPGSLPRANEFTIGSFALLPYSNVLTNAKVEQLSISTIPAFQFCVGLAVLMYALGHVLSLLLKQSVLAIAVSLISGIFLSLGVYYWWGAYDVPLLVVAVAPAICLFGLSFARGEDWITGRSAFPQWRKLCGWSLLGLWTLVSLLAGWRLGEITWSYSIEFPDLEAVQSHHLSQGLYLFARYFVFVTVSLLAIDWFRRNLTNPLGQSRISARRLATLTTIVAVSLVTHNLLIAKALMTYNGFLDRDSAEFLSVVDSDIREYGEQNQEEDLYAAAGEKIVGSFPILEDSLESQPQLHNQSGNWLKYAWKSWSDATPEQRAWLEENQQVLPLFFKADEHGTVRSTVMRIAAREESPRMLLRPLSILNENQNLILLARLQALKLEQAGQLAEAWKYHLAIVRYARKFASHNFPVTREETLSWLSETMLNGDLWRWQARKEQTPELLSRAAAELTGEMEQLAPLAEAFQRQGGWSLHFLNDLSTFDLVVEHEFLATLPWERDRLKQLIIFQTVTAATLAHQIDRGEVRFIDDGTGDSYIFSRGAGVNSMEWPVSLKLSDTGARLLIHRSTQRVSRSGVSNTQEFPFPDSTRLEETTALLKDSPNSASILGLIDKPLLDILLTELVFHESLSLWLSRAAIYSFRSEEGEFPGSINVLTRESERERFAPFVSLSRRVRDGRFKHMPNQISTLHQAIVYELMQSDLVFFENYHGRKWPQAEYNLGETPDAKPDPVLKQPADAPLEAPQPTQEQP